MEKTKNATENIEFVPYPKAKTFILKPELLYGIAQKRYFWSWK